MKTRPPPGIAAGVEAVANLPDDLQWMSVLGQASGVSADSTALGLQVSELECTSSRDPEPFMHEPYVVRTDDAVTVYAVSDAPEGAQFCPGNPSVSLTVDLGEPLGSRTVYDGSVWPPCPIGTVD